VTALLVGCHVLIGLVYTSYGTLTALELRRSWAALGPSHFGAAWIAMAFTCGPMHLVHATHLLEGTTPTLTVDLALALGALPSGVGWFLLRLEAFRGGRGDRFVTGDPAWLAVVPVAFVAVPTVLVVEAVHAGAPRATAGTALAALPLVVLSALYLVVAFYVGRTQLANRRPLGGWSLSGVALFVIFPTCAAMHGMTAWATATGRFAHDGHMLAVTLVGIPATVYFVAVVRALQRGSFRDWNRAPAMLAATREGSRRFADERERELV
jgi:hypothetical protein